METRISTPWGRSQTEREIAPGLLLVTTASHGGLLLAPDRVAELRAKVPSFVPFAGLPWLEEDCDVYAAIALWPEAFQPVSPAELRRTLNGMVTQCQMERYRPILDYIEHQIQVQP